MDTAEGSTITKADASPVTIADFASQAVVLRHLKSFFPNDIFLAEERSDTLTPQATALIQQASGIDDEEVLKECIDLGQQFFSRTAEGDCGEGHEPSTMATHSRFWCLDPIDGTKGFLRKEQYCVALGLVEDGIPTIGILACPNLPPSSNGNNEVREETGTIFVARRGHGCYELPLIPASRPPIQLTMGSSKRIHDAARARFCVGVEQAFSDPVGRCKEMAKILHGSLDTDGEILHSSRMDSQAKWGVIARGDSEFYVRLPRSDHREWLWDVAPGVVVLEEVGGKVTDAAGKCLNFSQGARLNSNGILGAATADLHSALLEAYRIS
jgi:HAL2 family 3'(2'),5'-bisphosphate nucleotidase